MKYSSQQYAEALYKSASSIPSKNNDEIVENFIEILKSHEVLYKYKSILKAYRTILMKNNKLPEVIMTCASDISNEVKEEVLGALEIDKKVKLRLRVDKKMIGGVFVKYNNRLFDLSLARRLARLNGRLLASSTK